MEITTHNLARFHTWLVERGRSDDTANLYTTNLRSCATDARGLTHRLVAGKLAPNSLRTNLAALRAWGKFSADDELVRRLSDIRLPPARRVRTKIPLELDVWRRAVQQIQTGQFRDPAMRPVLLIMALRGFRSGDVLRIRRTEVVTALATGKLIYEGKGRKRLEFSAEPIRGPLEDLAKIRGWERVADLLQGKGGRKSVSRKVYRAAQRSAAQAGIPQMNPHRYRHTFATNYLKKLAGDPNAIVKLQKYMGWESMATAARYVDTVSQDELDTIGAALMGGLLEP